MGRLMVITTPDLAAGFQLAGVETFAVENLEAGEALLTELLARGEASLIAVPQALLQILQPRLRRQIEANYQPLVVAIPAGKLTTAEAGRRHYITELIRRAIGFQITFDTRQKTEGQ